jgi:hypothetical protein
MEKGSGRNTGSHFRQQQREWWNAHPKLNGLFSLAFVVLIMVGAYGHPITYRKPAFACAAGLNLDWRDVVRWATQDSTRRAVEVYWRPLSSSTFEGIVYEFWIRDGDGLSISKYYNNDDAPCVRLREFTPGKQYRFSMRAGGYGGYLLSGDDTLFVSDTLWFLTDNGTEWTDSMSFTFPTAIETIRMGEQLVFTDIRTVADERFIPPDTFDVPPDTVPTDTIIPPPPPPDTIPTDTIIPPPPPPDTLPPPDTTVAFALTNITTAGIVTYVTGETGLSPLYVDRGYEFNRLDAELFGTTSIMTAYADRVASPDVAFLTFEVNKPVTVYVGIAQLPMAWVADAGFVDSGLRAEGRWSKTDRNFVFYARQYDAGVVTLGNSANGPMYVVVVVPD